MTTIRRMRLDEAPVLRALTKQGVAREAARYPEDRIAISDQGLDNLETHYRLGANHPDLFTLVAEQDGEIVGFVDAEVTRGRSLPGAGGEIGDLHLEEGTAPQVGEELVRKAVELLRERGARPIFHTEPADRPEREPWQNLGFEPDTIRYSLYD
jgi:ribosomal protein S18 acetylase RimI-like enzyme